ncbi:hypothetical protein RRU94_07845 [Domibacillus sp. DTU_2020_1001157_1_SI_ALB_TIR_016]|uniref:hypothetical protein n=1 Tax=Domibacillus sp. DTU_2020_1001157_1_SI_ALB_TIR_016 TaxID=3077789 RepID=UPI0028E59E84|nr:hypothetical protein [Domibacillus sp. DTU_2020_1001157_1_SI_ALB_TIR_016]WNS78361.1 hypothetical protein RRU94_07845 [Domibacillus sp. DTU_2020_1001157_1_SI_ALB_TIR_016]
MQELYSAATAPFKDSAFLNLPNTRFYEWCHKQYGLNRGVLNTIDNWFYDYGIINVMSRRIYMLAFLDYVKEAGLRSNGQKFIKFGHGGLSEKLKEFLELHDAHAYSI